MKIYIKLNDGKGYRIPAPIWLVKAVLVFGNFGVSIARKHVPEDQMQYIDCIDFKELRKGLNVLKDYKGLRLVEVKAGDGTEFTIDV